MLAGTLGTNTLCELRVRMRNSKVLPFELLRFNSDFSAPSAGAVTLVDLGLLDLC